MTSAEFVQTANAFAWNPNKTLIHMHHTWRPDHSQYVGLASIEGMYEYHINNNGWSDIAQHISIAPDGTVWSGRPWNKSPASALGFNSRSVFMFETIGDFDVGKDPLEGMQLDTVVTVIATIMNRFSLGAGALRFHNEMSPKTCPGSSVDKQAILDLVAERQEDMAASPAPLSAGDSSALERRDEFSIAAGSGTDESELDYIDEGEHPLDDPEYEAAIKQSRSQ
jgi:hypothetical protein